MKTTDALYEAIEAILMVHTAMSLDVHDKATKPAGLRWVKENRPKVTGAFRLLDEVRDSLNEGD